MNNLRLEAENVGKFVFEVGYLDTGCYMGCRWYAVVGYDIPGNPWAIDAYPLPAKPTKRQVRQLKKILR